MAPALDLFSGPRATAGGPFGFAQGRLPALLFCGAIFSAGPVALLSQASDLF
jgi:hypothetical protein